jgi:alkanesulfonate monooxygenase SsuD/methylene tetrahydromethanopterin reductase-like flavin-dependent oxidoreductase (luciferase family)
MVVGAARAGRDLAGFDVVPTVPVMLGDDARDCADAARGYAALYLGGMGSRSQNFYNALAVRMGYEAEAAQIQDLFLAKQYREAAAAVPWEFLDRTSLLGPPARVRDRLAAYADAGVTTLSVALYAATLEERLATLRTMAEVLDASGLAS